MWPYLNINYSIDAGLRPLARKISVCVGAFGLVFVPTARFLGLRPQGGTNTQTFSKYILVWFCSDGLFFVVSESFREGFYVDNWDCLDCKVQTSGTHTFETCLGLKGTTATIFLEDVRGAIETVHNFRQTSRDLNINGKHMDLLREISRKETFIGA